MPATTDLANAWFATRGFKPFAFQRQVWAALRPLAWGLDGTPPRIWRV